jgi:hypothetical protein
MSAPERPAALPPTVLLRSIRRVMRPVVRLLMQSGVTFPVLADLLRALFVDVAVTDLLIDRRAQTDSRVSLLTGVHRKEIRRLRQAETEPDAVPPLVTLASQIIARWLATPAFLDPDGRPLPLPRSARTDATEPSFESLVSTVTADVRARTVLDDWIAQGIVTLDADDRVRLNTSVFIPRPGSAEQLFFFARNLHDHIAAAAANIAAPAGPPFVDRSVHYDKLPTEAAQRLEALGREAAQSMLLAVNRAAMEIADRADATAAPAIATQRVNLGVFLYVEDEKPEPTG